MGEKIKLTLDKFMKSFNERLDSEFKENTVKTCWNNLSPLKWLGGKTFLVKWIYPSFPTHKNYVEVFGGAGSILFYKSPSFVEIYNDINNDLVNFFKQVQENPKELFKRLFFKPYSRSIFQSMKDQFRTKNYKDDLERAVIFFYINRASYGGRMKGASFGISLCSEQIHTNKTIISRVYFLEIERLFNYWKRIRNVIIENLDFRDLIKRYDREETLFYVDPPYINLNYYEDSFSEKDHRDLANILQHIKGKFILSYISDPLLEEIYPKDTFIWQSKELRNFMNLSYTKTKSKRTEVLIMNFDIEKTGRFIHQNQKALSSFFLTANNK